MRKRLIIWGYFIKNLGDDLMLSSFLNSNDTYEDIYIITKKQYVNYYKGLGVNTITSDSLVYKILNIILYGFHLHSPYFYLPKFFNADFMILGGSLFIESSRRYSIYQIRNLKYAVTKSSRSYVIGSNFGPYSTDEFYQNYKDIFSMCDDVCFRDDYSYQLFSSLNTTRYAPDIVLSGMWEKKNSYRKEEAYVVISVINLENRDNLKGKTAEFERKLKEISDYHTSNGERVILASFCKQEGDLVACERIKSNCKDQDLVTILNYENFDMLNIIKNAKILYGARFHSIILAIYYNIPCLPFVYSKKTLNALKSYTNNFSHVNLLDIENTSSDIIIKSVNKISVSDSVLEDSFNQLKGIK